ncbi:glycosyl transferase, group 1, partial [mine drainage metagenome]
MIDMSDEPRISLPFVVYWNNIPAPYMVERFNALADSGAFEFEAWFNDRAVPDRSWDVDESSWRFKYRYVPTTRIGGRRVLHWPWLVFGRRPDVLVSLYAEPVFIAGWLLAKLRGAKTGFWVEVTFSLLIKRRAYKAWIRRWLFRRVDAIVTVSEDGKRFAERAGANAEKIFYAPHVIDVSHYANAAQLARSGPEQLRTDLGLHGTTFVYVGRLWWGKGLCYLLEAFEAAQARSSDEISLLLVGDGPEESM